MISKYPFASPPLYPRIHTCYDTATRPTFVGRLYITEMHQTNSFWMHSLQASELGCYGDTENLTHNCQGNFFFLYEYDDKGRLPILEG